MKNRDEKYVEFILTNYFRYISSFICFARVDKPSNQYIDDIQFIISEARKKGYSSIASAMLEAYWKIGKRIVDEEQNGKERAVYVAMILKNLAAVLGKGFSARTLRDYRQFYISFSNWEEVAQLCAKLNWSHIRLLMRINDKDVTTNMLNLF